MQEHSGSPAWGNTPVTKTTPRFINFYVRMWGVPTSSNVIRECIDSF